MPPNLNFNDQKAARPVALVAPLDWGLGHATRCIPIIRQCVAIGFEVIVAADGPQRSLLSQEFPQLEFVELRGYNMKYARKGWFLRFSIMAQVPKILMSINKENRWLLSLAKRKHLALIVSDNRFGLYHPEIPSIFMTHQLNIISGLGRLVDGVISRINRKFISKYSACLVVDDSRPSHALAGKLSRDGETCVPLTRYTGVLTRFRKLNVPPRYNLLVLISGPEPQRSVFEALVNKELQSFAGRVCVVRGQPNAQTAPPATDVFNHLPAEVLNELVCASEVVLCRSGYSSVMDLLPLNKRCIFVPTPGQTEQEYLAAHLSAKGMCVSTRQDQLSLNEAYAAAQALDPGWNIEVNTFDLKALLIEMGVVRK